MKTTILILNRPALLLLGCLLAVSPARAGDWLSGRLDTLQEVFAAADTDRNNNLNAVERDQLRIAFTLRRDLYILDFNRNGKLDREEIDYLEKDRIKKPKRSDKQKQMDKNLSKKAKKRRG